MIALLGILVGACGGGEEAGVRDLQLVGVDFELNSIILTNNAAEDVRTENLWVYQDGESSRFNVFIIEPRATILFSVRDIGGVDPSGGEIALFDSDSFSDDQSILEYVAWGDSRHGGLETAIDAGAWNQEGPVPTESDTLIIVRADPNLTGPSAWTPANTLP